MNLISSVRSPMFRVSRSRRWMRRYRKAIMHKVLMAEDDSIFAMLVDHSLRNISVFNLEIMESAEEMLQMFNRKPSKFVVLDHGLPGISGLDALKKIKARSPSTKVIVLTQSRSNELKTAYMDAGADSFLLKSPLAAKALVQSLESFNRIDDEKLASRQEWFGWLFVCASVLMLWYSFVNWDFISQYFR